MRQDPLYISALVQEKKKKKIQSLFFWGEIRDREKERMGLRKRKALFPCVRAPGAEFLWKHRQNKSPSVLVANLSWCNLDVIFQAGISSGEKRVRQQYGYSTHGRDGRGAAPARPSAHHCIGLRSKLQAGPGTAEGL